MEDTIRKLGQGYNYFSEIGILADVDKVKTVFVIRLLVFISSTFYRWV